MTRLHEAARRALDSLNDLIANTTDPGVEALGARHELQTALIVAPVDRAAILREAADTLDESETLRDLTDDHMGDVNMATNELRRMADEVERVAGEAQQPEPAAALSGSEWQFLAFALDLAADQMASRGDEFSDDDRAALEKLRRVTGEAQQDKPWLSDSARIGRTLIWTWTDIGKGAYGKGYQDAQIQARAMLNGPQQPVVVSQPDGEA